MLSAFFKKKILSSSTLLWQSKCTTVVEHSQEWHLNVWLGVIMGNRKSVAKISKELGQ